jgi:hypothetical protein
VKPQPVLASVYQCPAGCKLEIKLAGIGQRWLEVERVMGIEYIARVRLLSVNQTVASKVVYCV